MKKLLFLAGLIGLCACSLKHGVQWTQGTFEDVLKAAREQNKPILVDFYSPT